jgi:D-aspartate ligase
MKPNFYDTSTPVVVLPSVHHSGLAITRSLGRLGVPVYNVAPSAFTPGSSSKYCRKTFLLDLMTEAGEQAVDRLLWAAHEIGSRSILIPTTDVAAIFVAEHADALGRSFLLPSLPGALVRSLCNKKNMQLLAKEWHVPTPWAFFPQSRADVLNVLDVAPFPLILKATEDNKLRRGGRRTKAIASDRHELMELYDAMAGPDCLALMVQEHIPGGAEHSWMFNGYFTAGSECLFGWTGRKIRQCPLRTGPTSLGICLPNEPIRKTAIGFMQAIGYRGIVDIDFCHDTRDGQYKLLDVNPRIGATFRLFVAEDGLDIARALYLDLTGQPLALTRVPDGRKWIVEDFDLLASLGYHRDGRLTLREWLRSLHGIQEWAFLALDDPLPILSMLRADLSELWRRRRRRRGAVPRFEFKKRTMVAAPASDQEKISL